MVFPGKRLYRVEREGFLVVDTWKAYVSDNSLATILIPFLLCSGFGKKYSDVCHVSLRSITFIHGHC
jgi:hypothetical protein